LSITKVEEENMDRNRRIETPLVIVALLVVGIATADAPTGMAGRWDGAIEVPDAALEVQIDLEPADGGWSGTISIPAQNARDLPLADITVDGTSVGFSIEGLPGDPAFEGTLEGDAIAGEFTQAGQAFPFRLSRGEDRVAAATESLAGIDAVIERALGDFGVPGLGLGVVVDGEVVLARGYGKRDVEADLPVTADTLFAIGSSSKAFTTFVLGTLVDEGTVDWDEPVRTYLPDFRMADEHATANLTVRDLVCHRSGLPRHDLAWYNSDATRSELVHRLRYLEPFADLREEFHYQNLMYLTAGYLIEEVTGTSWEDNVRQRIFEPLGMGNSNFSVLESQESPDFSQPHHRDEGKTVQIPFRDITTIGPAGSINSSINDMTRWLQVQLGGGTVDGRELIQRATLTEMHTPQMAISAYPEPDDVGILQSYGLGWFIESFRGRYLVHHGGGIDGFITLVAFLPQEGIGVVTLTNSSASALSPTVNRMVIDRLLGETDKDWLGEALERQKKAEATAERAEEEKTLVRVEGTSPSHPLEDYVGEYEDPGYGILTIGLADGALEVSYNQMTKPLEHWHYDVFEAQDEEGFDLGGTKFQFRTDVDGRIVQVVAPFEPEAGDIVFDKRPDRRLSDPEYLERFTGTYELSGRRVTVSLRGTNLIVQTAGQPSQTLAPVEGTTFQIEGLAGITVTFVEEDGAVTAVRFNQPTGVYTAERVEAEVDE
jgi:CubicO group peptidase (beta-lactamase class C family)